MKVAREAVWKFAGATKPRGGDRLQSSSELKWYQRPVRMMRLDYLDALDRMKNADLDALAQRILDFQDRFNATAEPFDWTFTRDDLHTLLARIDAHEPTATPHAA